MSHKISVDDRVLDSKDQTGTVTKIEGDEAHVLMDTQAPSSEPKVIPLTDLTFVSASTKRRSTNILDKV